MFACRIAALALLGAALALPTPSLDAQSRQPDPPRRPFLFKDARGELAAARARGDTGVTLVVAGMPGGNARLAAEVKRLGGTVRFRDDDVDYLRIHLHVDKVDRIVAHPLTHSADVSISRLGRALGYADGGDDADGSVGATARGPMTPFPAAEYPHTPTATRMGAALAGAFVTARGEGSAPADTTRRPWPPILPETPLIDRYDPTGDLGAKTWREQNPTFDGRGVGIAIIDQSLDALLPELEVARRLDGTPTRKIVDYVTVVDPDEEEDGQWVSFRDSVVTDATGRFTFRDSAYVAPAPGRYRVNVIDEAVFDSLNRAGIDKDLNRDGNPKGSSRLFTVLWDMQRNLVWLDTNQDRDFRNEKGFTDYATQQEFGVLGTDNPATPVRESVSFAVQTDRAKQRVALNFGVQSHASLVVGAAVASKGTRGRFEGVAPGAVLVNVAEGGAAYGQTEAVIRAVKHPAVDVVFLEQSSVIARNYLLFDGRLVPTVIYGRLIAKFGKAIAIPTHNYAVLAAIDDYALAPGAISVGGHESKENFFKVHGVRVQHDDNLLVTGGYGPMGNGAAKPDIIAPSNYISTGRGFLDGTSIPGLMELPPGYNIAGGTSTATPTTAGAVALLISAAKQRGVRWDGYRIRQALMTSARWVPHLPAYKQGNGVVNVEGAWRALVAMDSTRAPITITTAAPVRHSTSHLLATPHAGVGLFERDGWRAGDAGTRVVQVTRTSGPRRPVTVTVGWVGNDSATYASPSSITLPLNQAVALPVQVNPRSAGVHSALLTFDDPATPGVEYRTLMTVVAAYPLAATSTSNASAGGTGRAAGTAAGAMSDSAPKPFVHRQQVEIPRPGMTHLYYHVPAGVRALRVEVQAPKRRPTVAIMRPDTRPVTGSFPAPQVQATQNNMTYWVTEPVSGVWEVRLQDVEDTRTFDWQQAKKMEPVPPTPATVIVTAIGADVSVQGEVPRAGLGGEVGLTVMNPFGAITGGAVSLPMGAERAETFTLARGAQRAFTVNVPAGTPMLLARARVTNGAADADVYVFDCTGKECVAARADGDAVADGSPEEEVVLVRAPAAGRWVIVVDHAGMRDGDVTVAYHDVLFNPAFGAVSVVDQPADRASGASWETRARVWSSGGLPERRTPYPAIGVQLTPKGTDAHLLTPIPLVKP